MNVKLQKLTDINDVEFISIRQIKLGIVEWQTQQLFLSVLTRHHRILRLANRVRPQHVVARDLHQRQENGLPRHFIVRLWLKVVEIWKSSYLVNTTSHKFGELFPFGSEDEGLPEKYKKKNLKEMKWESGAKI